MGRRRWEFFLVFVLTFCATDRSRLKLSFVVLPAIGFAPELLDLLQKLVNGRIMDDIVGVSRSKD